MWLPEGTPYSSNLRTRGADATTNRASKTGNIGKHRGIGQGNHSPEKPKPIHWRLPGDSLISHDQREPQAQLSRNALRLCSHTEPYRP